MLEINFLFLSDGCQIHFFVPFHEHPIIQLELLQLAVRKEIPFSAKLDVNSSIFMPSSFLFSYLGNTALLQVYQQD